MTVETLIVSTIQTHYEIELRHCDAGRVDEHYEVNVTDRDPVKCEEQHVSGFIVARLRASTLTEARELHCTLCTIATLGD